MVQVVMPLDEAKIRWIILHCSRTQKSEGDDYFTVERKCRKRGCFSCGYHWIVNRAGLLIPGRPEGECGNHIVGYNDKSIAVCFIGMPGSVTKRQREMLQKLLLGLARKFPSARLATHAGLDPKTPDCPGFPLKNLLKDIS
jgi:hypothetical protein